MFISVIIDFNAKTDGKQLSTLIRATVKKITMLRANAIIVLELTATGQLQVASEGCSSGGCSNERRPDSA